MFNKKDKNQARQVRHLRVRNKISGTPERPRLNVYRSLNEIYAQVIDDVNGTTMDKELSKQLEGKNKTEQAKIVGLEIAKRAKANKIEDVVFDRGGYLYTGRVQALADGAREGGLRF